MKKYCLFLSFLVCSIYFLKAQKVTYFQSADEIKIVNSKGDSIRNPWAGGLRNPTFSNIDMNFDGKNDLFVFDHYDSTIAPYINTGNGEYRYAPEYISSFPSLIVWAFLVDYNHDGLPDIFAYSHERAGIEVYKNVSSNNTLKFKLVNSFIWTIPNACFNSAQVYSDQVNMPAFVDMDGDGDIDILTMDGSGINVNLYKNRCADKFGTNYAKYDSLYYDLSEDLWGAIQGKGGVSNYADSFAYPPDIHVPGETHCPKRHAGSNLLCMDADGDGDMDMVWSDINGAGLCLLRNCRIHNGKPYHQYDSIINYDSMYLHSICPFFPGAFYVDANDDGIRDLLVSPMQLTRSESIHNVLYYKNTGTDKSPVFDTSTAHTDFLQRDELDLGDGAFPAFIDRDSDGIPEFMAVATHGDISDKNWGNDRLALFKNVSTKGKNAVFKKIDNDWLSLSKRNIQLMAPAFGDMDGDGLLDMLIGQGNGKLLYYHNIGNSIKDSFTHSANAFIEDSIDVGDFSAPAIADIDGDHIADIVIGNLTGTFTYYKGLGYQTAGSKKLLNYQFITDKLGNAVTTDTNAYYPGGSSPVVTDLNKDGKLDLISGSATGDVYLYLDISSNLTGTFTRENQVFFNQLSNKYENRNFGQMIHPAVALLNSDTFPDFLIGNDKGGIYYFSSSKTIVTTSHGQAPVSQVHLYPNPARNFINIGSSVNFSSFRIVNMFGQTVLSINGLNTRLYQINSSSIPNGIYFIEITDVNQKTSTEKLIISR